MRLLNRLNRSPSHRWAMMRTMVSSLIMRERIRTTLARGKELRRVADRCMRYAKRGTEHDRKLAGAIVRDRPTLEKLFGELGPRYFYRPGGYTRIIPLQRARDGDAAKLCVVEFVDRKGEARRAKPVDKYVEAQDLAVQAQRQRVRERVKKMLLRSR